MSTLVTGLDLESTGLKWENGDRIIELCMVVYRFSDRKKLMTYTQRYSNQGAKIAAKAQAVHGISAADLLGKPKFEDHARKVQMILDRSAAVVAHNGISFDIPFIIHELTAAKVDVKGEFLIIDTMREGMFASYDSKSPKLEELCYALGVDYDRSKAHAADYDVSVMMDSFFAGVDRGLFDVSSLTEHTEKEAA